MAQFDDAAIELDLSSLLPYRDQLDRINATLKLDYQSRASNFPSTFDFSSVASFDDGGSVPGVGTYSNGRLYFVGDGKLYYSDGTASGTQLVREFSDSGNTFSEIVRIAALQNRNDIAQNITYFITTAGDLRTVSPNDGVVSLVRSGMVGTNRVLPVYGGAFFTAGASETLHYRLGTGAPLTVKQRLANPPTTELLLNNVSNLSRATFGSQSSAVFVAPDSIGISQVWRFDLSSDPHTVIATKLTSFQSNSQPLTNLVGSVTDKGILLTIGTQLWKSDGTPGGTVLVKEFHPSMMMSKLTMEDRGRLAFAAGPTSQLLTSDGTAGGAVVMNDAAVSPLSNVIEIIASGESFYVSAAGSRLDGVSAVSVGNELWHVFPTRASSSTNLLTACNGGCRQRPFPRKRRWPGLRN